ncbi:GntR family transcriptional regulator [Brevibacterium sp. VCM10]|uniref:GntR family transcriptional regulator n=1 Tax=Brevibacterium sp. VCM10 TaxID=1381751 RepID=UPI0004BA1FE5|nr:GntR family transcriptional regulator [Brevibacterium sp. VCM10]
MMKDEVAGRPPEHKSLKQIAIDELRRRIFTRELGPGTRVDQVAIAKEMGMSRIPVREAISALVVEGMLEMKPRRGTFVVPLRKSDIADHYWVMAMISTRTIERAAEHITPEAIAQLESLADGMEAAVTHEGRERLNFEFHSIINHSADSRRLLSVLRGLGRPIPLRYYESHGKFAKQADREHREMIAALKSGDSERAAAVMANHFDNGVQDSIAVLEDQGFWEDSED